MIEATVTTLRHAHARIGDSRLLYAFVGCALLLRLPFLATPLGIDEGGYAYVATHWGDGSGGLYGGQWVDRPPLLIALYAAALHLGGDIGVRLLGCIAAVVVVAASADVAGRIAGPRAMRWSGLVAMVLASSTVTQSVSVNAELPAIACTVASVWLVVVAATCRDAWAQWWIGAGAGAMAMAAVLVKQSFVDGFAFASVFAAVWALTLRRGGGLSIRRPAARLVAAGLAGAAVVLSMTIIWANLYGPGVGPLIDALYGFRLEAKRAIDASPEAPRTRAVFFAAIAAVTGMLTLFAYVVGGLVRTACARMPGAQLDERALVRASAAGLLAMGSTGLIGVALGGNWWMHYLIQLAPFLAIGAGVVAAAPRRTSRRSAHRTRRWAVAVVITSLVGWGAALGWTMTEHPQRTPMAVGDWIRAAARPGDTAFITWGHANVLHRSGLRSPYAMSWSLLTRVRDPHLDQLLKILKSDNAPTFIVEWRPFGSWGLDQGGRVRAVVQRRYERMPSVCGKAIYRLRSRADDPIPPTDASACGSDRGLSIGDTKLF